jgi:hypothetical protein
MKISQPERGGNGESVRVVNQWLRWQPVDLRGVCINKTVAPNHQSGPIFDPDKEFF